MADGNSNNRLLFIIGGVVVVVALLFFLMSGDGPDTAEQGVDLAVTVETPDDPANDAPATDDPGDAIAVEPAN